METTEETAVQRMYRRAQEIADARKAEAWAQMRCEACGEVMKEDGRAEVVRKNDPLLETRHARHLIVHAEPCFIPNGEEKFLQA